jgi:hypothetical protein
MRRKVSERLRGGRARRRDPQGDGSPGAAERQATSGDARSGV